MDTPMRTTKILSITLPPAMLKQAERLAKEENRTKSELVREALRRYMQDRDWQNLRAYGSAKVRELGLKESDTERLIQEYRRKGKKLVRPRR